MNIDTTKEIIIGLEIHVELKTDSKLFCSCATHPEQDEKDIPNTRVCEVCLGHPGSKPVVNKKAVIDALKLCLALKCNIAPNVVFSRKSYFYPDMSKNYQISQYEEPLGTNGCLKVGDRNISIKRVHLEEDPAALIHHTGYCLIDYNRSGDPLVEVVTNPEIYSPEEARQFMKKLLTILNYLGIFDINRCVLKADANISISQTGYKRVEIKNVTGFREIEQALFYEVERQHMDSAKVKQETRGWDSVKGISYSLREKESEEEYGYIIDPDLVRIEIDKQLIRGLQETLPELSEEKYARFREMGVKPDDAEIIANEKFLAELFEKVAEKVDPMLAARWLRRELLRVLNYSKKELSDLELDEKHIIDLLKLVSAGDITEATAQKILERLVEKPFDVGEHIKKEGLGIVKDEEELIKICKEVIAANSQAVEDYKKGEQKAFNFLVGQVMKRTRGTAAPDIVNRIVRDLIKG